MNEWELQEQLVERWITSGIPLASGERLLMAAWEVMDNWEINDSRKEWNRPSIDFVGLDIEGRMAAIELKNPHVTAPALAWTQLCQVTVRAVTMARTYRPGRLRHANDECLGGEHGRVDASLRALDERFEALFQSPLRLAETALPVRRIIAAPVFGPRVSDLAAQFSAQPLADTARYLRSMYSLRSGQLKREVERLEGFAPSDSALLHGPVELLTV